MDISIYVYGYIPFASSTFNILDEDGMALGVTNYNNENNYCHTGQDFTATIAPADFNAWNADGSIDFTFTPTSLFFPFGCSRQSEICIQFRVTTQDYTGIYFGGSALNGPVNIPQVYFSNDLLESSQQIQGPHNNITYQSAQSIHLSPNFSVASGNVFHAINGGCEE